MRRRRRLRTSGTSHDQNDEAEHSGQPKQWRLRALSRRFPGGQKRPCPDPPGEPSVRNAGTPERRSKQWIANPPFNWKLKKTLGVEIDEELFEYAKQYARRKLEVANKSVGRTWGEDGYGDEYLSLLIPDVIREMAFSAYCDKRSAENLAARKAVS